jgi:hypothetical protein
MTDTQESARVQPAAGEPPSAVAQATDHAKELASHAGDEVAHVLDTGREQARGVVAGARTQIAGEADRVTGRAADALATRASELSDLASGRGSPDSQGAQLVRQVADRVDAVAAQLRDRGYQGVVDDVSRWARSHPGAFLAATAGAGFVIGRLVRTSDTKGIVDAAKGSATGQDGADEQGAAGANDPIATMPDAPMLDTAGASGSLFADEPRAAIADPTMPPPAPVDPQIDLTEPPPGRGTGV